jgi:hypothetical protein
MLTANNIQDYLSQYPKKNNFSNKFTKQFTKFIPKHGKSDTFKGETVDC